MASNPEGSQDLVKMWEGNSNLRKRIRETGQMTAWKNKQVVGLTSVEAMSYNLDILENLAAYWSTVNSMPRAVPISLIREQVGF